MSTRRQAPLLADRDLEEVAAEVALITRDATWRAGAQLALELVTNARVVQYWGEPQEHRPGPLYHAWRFLRALFRAQRDPAKRYLPLHWLCEQAGGCFVIEADEDARDVAGINQRLSGCIGSFGHLLAEAETAIADGTVDDREIDAIRGQLREHRSKLYQAEESLTRAHQERRRLT